MNPIEINVQGRNQNMKKKGRKEKRIQIDEELNQQNESS